MVQSMQGASVAGTTKMSPVATVGQAELTLKEMVYKSLVQRDAAIKAIMTAREEIQIHGQAIMDSIREEMLAHREAIQEEAIHQRESIEKELEKQWNEVIALFSEQRKAMTKSLSILRKTIEQGEEQRKIEQENMMEEQNITRDIIRNQTEIIDGKSKIVADITKDEIQIQASEIKMQGALLLELIRAINQSMVEEGAKPVRWYMKVLRKIGMPSNTV